MEKEKGKGKENMIQQLIYPEIGDSCTIPIGRYQYIEGNFKPILQASVYISK